MAGSAFSVLRGTRAIRAAMDTLNTCVPRKTRHPTNCSSRQRKCGALVESKSFKCARPAGSRSMGLR